MTIDKIELEKQMCRLKQGEINALDQIYALTSRGVYLLSFSILKDSERAKDILQETFIRMTANINKYKLNTNATAWIYKIARNLSYREHQRNKRFEPLNDYPTDNCTLWTQDIDLDNAIAQLNEHERELISLYSLGFKHREIAAITNKPLGTVLWQFNQAIKKMRAYLK